MRGDRWGDGGVEPARRTFLTTPVLGVLLGFGVLCVVLILGAAYAMTAARRDARDEGRARAAEVEARQIAPQPAPVAANPVAPAQPKEDPPPAGLREAVSRDGLEVIVSSVDFHKAEGTLWVGVAMRTFDASRKYNYEGWASPLAPLRQVKVFDDLGNNYAPAPFDLARDAAMQFIRDNLKAAGGGFGPGTVYADSPRLDVLVFERPVAAYSSLGIEFDGKTIGVEGVYRFRINRADVSEKP